jgi:hypothetical protein
MADDFQATPPAERTNRRQPWLLVALVAAFAAALFVYFGWEYAFTDKYRAITEHMLKSELEANLGPPDLVSTSGNRKWNYRTTYSWIGKDRSQTIRVTFNELGGAINKQLVAMDGTVVLQENLPSNEGWWERFLARYELTACRRRR